MECADQLSERNSIQLTILFQEPFWVGIFQKESNGYLSVAKVVFGSEPQDFQVNEMLSDLFDQLDFSPLIKEKAPVWQRKNPKRKQREAREQTLENGIGTRSQQALALLHEQNKLERHRKTKSQKEQEELRKFQIKQQKRQEKHRGH